MNVEHNKRTYHAFTAKKVQELLEVKDRQVIAHGYGPSFSGIERLTYDIWFERGKLYHCGYVTDYSDHSANERKLIIRTVQVHRHFRPNWFFDNIKRWYPNSVPQTVLDWFYTFGQSLPVTTTNGAEINEPPDISGFASAQVDID